MTQNGRGPSVSVILPTLNERAFIRDCLDSLLRQDYPPSEILVVDGGSTDGTRTIAAASPAPVALLDNPGVTAAAAMNVGIGKATGDIICRADAHALYASDYIRQCVATLEESGVENVGGAMRAVGTTAFGRAVAAVTSSPFGIGPGRFHYSRGTEEVDTVYLGCWRRQTLEQLGGYDESSLQWAAEDHELNFRLRRSGGRILLSSKIRSVYFPRETSRGLRRQYFNYGITKASTLAKHRSLPTWRPLAPAGLVAATVVAAGALHGWQRLVVPVAHTVVCAFVAASLSRDPGVAPHRALLVLETCHWSYGLGFWAGMARPITGRGFDTRPRGHR